MKCLLFDYRLNNSDIPYMNYMIEEDGIWSDPDTVSIDYHSSGRNVIIYDNGKFHACGTFAFTFYGDIGYTFYEPQNSVLGKGLLSNYSFKMNCYPNPFNQLSVINYHLSADCNVNLTIYNIEGREVATLVTGRLPLGDHTVKWDAKNIPSGIYFAVLNAGGISAAQKLLLVK